jgi:hypothetical protein
MSFQETTRYAPTLSYEKVKTKSKVMDTVKAKLSEKEYRTAEKETSKGFLNFS